MTRMTRPVISNNGFGNPEDNGDQDDNSEGEDGDENHDANSADPRHSPLNLGGASRPPDDADPSNGPSRTYYGNTFASGNSIVIQGTVHGDVHIGNGFPTGAFGNMNGNPFTGGARYTRFGGGSRQGNVASEPSQPRLVVTQGRSTFGGVTCPSTVEVKPDASFIIDGKTYTASGTGPESREVTDKVTIKFNEPGFGGRIGTCVIMRDPVTGRESNNNFTEHGSASVYGGGGGNDIILGDVSIGSGSFRW